MERLTQRNEQNTSYYYPECFERCHGEGCREECNICPVEISIIEKLGQYEDAEEQGKLVLYPSEAYFIKNKEVHKGWVQEAVYAITRKPLFDIRYDDNSLASYRGYLGNEVFLTKEEAEQKLESMKGEV